LHIPKFLQIAIPVGCVVCFFQFTVLIDLHFFLLLLIFQEPKSKAHYYWSCLLLIKEIWFSSD